MIRKTFIHKIVTDMILTGNAVAYPQMKNGLIDNLKILNTDSLHFDEDGDSYQIRYRGTLYYPDEVLHFV